MTLLSGRLNLTRSDEIACAEVKGVFSLKGIAPTPSEAVQSTSNDVGFVSMNVE